MFRLGFRKAIAESGPKHPPKLENARTGSDPATFIDVPIRCAQKDTGLVVRFRQIGKERFEFDRFILDAGRGAFAKLGQQPPMPRSIPVDSLSFSTLRCPLCQGLLLVQCSNCDRLVCQGRTQDVDDRRYFRCTLACNGEGWISGKIENVMGNEGQNRKMAFDKGLATNTLLEKRPLYLR